MDATLAMVEAAGSGPLTQQRAASSSHASRTRAQRFSRQAVLVTPLVLVNAAAVYGQVQWATVNLTAGSIGLAVLFALTVESIAVYLAYEAHAALLAGDASFRLRAASYLAAGLVGVLNYSHFAGPGLRPTAAALAFGALSSISPWLWSIRSRSLRRDQLRAAGLIDPRSAHFAAAKWLNFPIRTIRAYRWSVDHGVQEERAAWEAYRAAQHHRRAGVPEPEAQGRPEATRRRRGRQLRRRSSTPNPMLVNGGPALRSGDTRASANGHKPANAASPGRAVDVDAGELRRHVQAAVDAGEQVTGATVGQWLGVSARTGRRRLSELTVRDPTTADSVAGT
jgi:hypothetical protein